MEVRWLEWKGERERKDEHERNTEEEQKQEKKGGMKVNKIERKNKWMKEINKQEQESY